MSSNSLIAFLSADSLKPLDGVQLPVFDVCISPALSPAEEQIAVFGFSIATAQPQYIQHSNPVARWLNEQYSRLGAARQPSYRRSQQGPPFTIPRNVQFAMHHSKPMFAYIRPGTTSPAGSTSGQVVVRHLLTQQLHEVGPCSSSSHPMLWIDDILEYSFGNRRERWNVSDPLRGGVIHLNSLPTPIGSVPMNPVVCNTAPAGERVWALLIDRTAASSTAPSMFLYDCEHHIHIPLVKPFNSSCYTTLLSFRGQCMLISVESRDTVTGDHLYQVQLRHADNGFNRIAASSLRRRPLNNEGKPKRLLAVEAIDMWGLVFVRFEDVTHIYALKTEGWSIRMLSPQPFCDQNFGLEVLERITTDIATRQMEALIRKERFLAIEVHQAIAMSDVIQETLSSLNSNHLARPPILKLLQDLCASSGQLPSSYLMRGRVDPRKYLSRGGEADILESWHTSEDMPFTRTRIVLRRVRDNSELDSSGQMLKAAAREIVIHKLLHHPSIVELLGVWTDEDGKVYMVLPFLNPLPKSSLRSDVFLRLVRDIVAGVKYLHEQTPPVIHGDIHPDNILVDEPGHGILCDFGCSRVRHIIPRSKTIKQCGLMYRYAAPELPESLRCEPFHTTEASDVYSLALTIYRLATWKPPFDGIGSEEARRLAQLKRRPERVFCENLTDGLWRLLVQMWDHNPQARPTMSQVSDSVSEL